jgi:hypothetical protein
MDIRIELDSEGRGAEVGSRTSSIRFSGLVQLLGHLAHDFYGVPQCPPHRVSGLLHIQASRHAGNALVTCSGQ